MQYQAGALCALFAILPTLTAQDAPATGQRLWVGTSDGKIRSFTLTPDRKLRLEHTASTEKRLQFVAFHPERKMMYVAAGRNIVTYRYEGNTPHKQASLDAGLRGTHVEVDPGGKFVFLASYGGGAVSVYPLSDRGIPGAESFSIRSPEELTRRAHQVRAHPAGRFVYAPCLGDDVVQILALTKEGVRSRGRARLATSSGPRHLDFDPKGSHLYVLNELASTVYAYRIEPSSGALTEIQTLNALPEGRKEGSRSSDIHVSHNGRFVYAVHREPLNEIVTMAVADTGEVTIKGRTKTGGVHSRSFALTRDDKTVVFGHSKTRNVIVRTVDSTTGLVGDQTHSVDVGAAAVFVGFAPKH